MSDRLSRSATETLAELGIEVLWVTDGAAGLGDPTAGPWDDAVTVASVERAAEALPEESEYTDDPDGPDARQQRWQAFCDALTRVECDADTTLDGLLDTLRNAPDDGIDSYARCYALPLAHGEIDWTSLPTFGGEAPADTREVLSWDADSLLIYAGGTSEPWRIVPRWSPQAQREVRAAIRRSQTEDRTVTLPWSAEAETELLALSDDSADSEGETEYWGESQGGTWRVHLRREGGE